MQQQYRRLFRRFCFSVFCLRPVRSVRSVDSSRLRIRRRGIISRRVWLGVGLGIMAVSVVLLMLHLPRLTATKLVPAVHVTYATHDLGLLPDAAQAQDALQNVLDAVYSEYKLHLSPTDDWIVRPVLADPYDIGTMDGVERGLARYLDLQAEAAVILIDGIPVAALPTRQDALWVLDQALEPYQQLAAVDPQIQHLGFYERVATLQDTVAVTDIEDKHSALDKLISGTGHLERYTVRQGDTLWNIAASHQLQLSDLRLCNPSIADTDLISVGQELILGQPQNLVNVTYVKTITQIEPLPYITIIQTDDSRYTTQQQVLQPGIAGTREVVAQVTYINGLELSREIVSQSVITAAVDQIVVKGTKPVPQGQAVTAQFMRPLEGQVSSRFGQRWGRLHAGLDIAADIGTPIYASCAGTVSFSGVNGNYGYMVKIDHGNGIETRYAHCSELLVSVGQQVAQGELIALVGNTGNSTGPHCHFEIRINGEAIDPESKL